MSQISWKAMQENQIDRGKMQIQVKSRVQNRPISGAKITISYKGVPQEALEKVETDKNGQTEFLELPAPPVEYSLQAFPKNSLILNIMFGWMLLDLNRWRSGTKLLFRGDQHTANCHGAFPGRKV